LLMDRVLVGNKHDLKRDREVTIDEAETLARFHGIAYIEASAKNGHSVDELFACAQRACAAAPVEEVKPKEEPVQIAQPAAESSCC
jgi:hypothetical protein